MSAPVGGPRDEVLVDVATLAADLQLGGVEDPLGGAPVLLDVRWELGRSDGREQYEAGHLPGAAFVDLETELAAPPSAAEGRHPLPSATAFQEAARSWGVHAHSRVVVYDAVGGTSAARAWWLLRWFGHERVRLLDGGLTAWLDAGLPLEAGPVEREPGDVVVHPGGMPVLDADGAADAAAHGVLLDARAAERYRGEVEPVDPRAGHVPGAISAPTVENLSGAGTFRPAAELVERFTGLGATRERPVGVYCGSGVTASHEVAALASVGVAAALYPGSWSQWSNDPARSAAT
ncbi:sulfurtransferase [Isoptericola halotolerans]|uniref:sulfurtransferase n=1 Tax=Isoptericola halotolerans TaxID=300560 RepID=UPI00388D9308